jgi:acetyltransferase-like isoleucine patch superfamily enzyme
MAARVVCSGNFVLHRLTPGNTTKNIIQQWILARLLIYIGARSHISLGNFVFSRNKFSCDAKCSLSYKFGIWNRSSFTVANDLLDSHGVKAICGTPVAVIVRTNTSGPIKIDNNVRITGANFSVTRYVTRDSIIDSSPARILRRNASASAAQQT